MIFSSSTIYHSANRGIFFGFLERFLLRVKQKKGVWKKFTPPVTGLLSLVTGRRKAARLRLPFIVWCWLGRAFGLSLPLQNNSRQATDEKKSTILFFIYKNPSATGSFHRPVTSDRWPVTKRDCCPGWADPQLLDQKSNNWGSVFYGKTQLWI